MVFEAALLNNKEAIADQSLLPANTRQFLDASPQKSTEDFFMCVIDHVHGEGLVFHTRISQYCGVIKTTAGARHEDIRRFITK